MAINLSRDAQQLLGAYQQVADLTPKQEDALAALAQGEKPVCKDQLEKLLDAGCLKQAHALVKCDPRGDDAVFNTQIIGRPKVVKENVQVQRPRRPAVNMGMRDPYYAKMEIDPRASIVALTSGSKFEPGAERPRPRLMKLVVRTEATDGQPTEQDWANLDKLMVDSNIKKQVWDPKGEVPTKELDVHWIGSKTASIETKDVNEPEFDFGSSMVAISASKDGGELSRVNAIDPVNIQRTQVYAALGNTNNPNFAQPIGAPQDRVVQDSTPPETFDHKIGIDLNGKGLPQGTWINSPGVGAKLDMNLRLGSRWLMEAGANGSVTLLGQALSTKVAKDDVYFNGSHSAVTGVPVAENYSIENVLGQPVRKTFGRVPTDTKSQNLSVHNLVFARHKGVSFGGHHLSSGPKDLTYADGQVPGINVTKRPINDAERNGLAFDIDLGPELLCRDGGSFKGFTVDVGYHGQDAEGNAAWCPASHKGGEGLMKLGTKGFGADSKFTLNFADFPQARLAEAPVEVIVRDNHGIPVARMQVPLDAVNWA